MDEMDKQTLKILKDQIKEVLLLLWSILPLFSVTPSHDYISLINILLGEINIRFILFPIHSHRFKWIHVRIFSRLPAFMLSDEKTEELKRNYRDHYAALNDQDRQIEKQALLRHLNDEKERINTSFTKITAYSAIFLVFISFLIGRHIHLKDISIMKVIIAYSAINAGMWIFQAMCVRGLYQSRFSDLKKSKDKEQEYTWQIYYDWQQYKRKADMFVSFVGYTEYWIIIVIVLVIIHYLS